MLARQTLLLDNGLLVQIDKKFNQTVFSVFVCLNDLDVGSPGRWRDASMAAIRVLEKADHLVLRGLSESDHPELDVTGAMEFGADDARRL